MTDKHTPGPWAMADWHSGRVVDRDGRTVSTSSTTDARLIAAAPDLLAAAKDALLEISALNVYTALRAAIAKAEGAGNG